MDWTKEQEQAINEKDSNILVAAAAGSGKTAVLVERIIHKIIDEKIDIDQLLVVTFTNAAASEMRERVLDAIYKKLDENPEEQNLQRQITLLNKASICTIDSFCLEIVRNYFYELDNVSPNFRIGDTTEIELLKQEVIEEIFEKKYEEENEDFIKLINTYTSYKDDTPLKDLTLKIYSYIQSNPFPQKWLREKIEMFNIIDDSNIDNIAKQNLENQKNEKNKKDEKIENGGEKKEEHDDFSNTMWGKELLKELEEELIDDITTLIEVEESLSYDTELEKFKQTIRSDIDMLQTLKNNLYNWDKAYEISQNISFITWPRKKVESEIKAQAKEIRDSVKDKLKKVLNKILICDSKEAQQDIQDMYSILVKLENLILEFEEEFSKRKREKNVVDFNDIEHFALKILLKEVDGKIEPTEVAKKYKEKYKEIAIDEYQDSNLVQEYILNSVSKQDNIFMVGDVKQSIYKFRQAMPELFLSKYETYKTIENKEKEDNLKIKLFKNFRSRDNVLKFTNTIFQNIMSNVLGDIEYNEEEYLNLGADYPSIEQNLKTEISIINLKDDESETENAFLEGFSEEEDEEGEDKEKEIVEERIEDIELEARFVANKIKTLIDSKYQVWDRKKNEYRDIEYKDIVVLLRSTATAAPVYEQELLRLELPVFSDTSQEYLDSIEIQTIMSLLKIIDNPIQDIPLVTVLRSNIGKFTDNELVQIRLADKYDNFYTCMQKSKVSVDIKLRTKIENFFDNLNQWRKQQEYLSLDELIWKIYIDTGYYNYVGLMPNGALRQANLKMLFQRAKQYESSNFKGLYNFINFIEKLKLSSGDMGSAKLIGENDNVIRIMSIHKSKGLEFPVVFLSSTGKQFNLMDLNQNVLLHQDMGIGVKYIDYEKQIQYDTLTKVAMKNKILVETLSEEMRILYVALTRAKEKLFITGLSKDYEKESEKLEQQVNRYSKDCDKINPILVKKYKRYLDWIMLVYKYEESKMKDLAELNVYNKKELLNTFKDCDKEEIDIVELLEKQKVEQNKTEELEKILNFSYENEIATTIPTKTSVTKIKQLDMQENLEPSLDSLLIKEDSTIEENDEVSEKDTVHIQESNFSKPQFLKNEDDNKLTSAQKGTLVHLCLQKLDERKDYTIELVKELINELLSKQIITTKEAEAISPYKVLAFTKSVIWQELKNAKQVEKEKPFYINIPAREIYKQEIEEDILVQGIIDLYYINENDELVLVDYKTDYVENGREDELVNKYTKQLELYKQALESALDRKVDKVFIYSVYLEKELEVDK